MLASHTIADEKLWQELQCAIRIELNVYETKMSTVELVIYWSCNGKWSIASKAAMCHSYWDDEWNMLFREAVMNHDEAMKSIHLEAMHCESNSLEHCSMNLKVSSNYLGCCHVKAIALSVAVWEINRLEHCSMRSNFQEWFFVRAIEIKVWRCKLSWITTTPPAYYLEISRWSPYTSMHTWPSFQVDPPSQGVLWASIFQVVLQLYLFVTDTIVTSDNAFVTSVTHLSLLTAML